MDKTWLIHEDSMFKKELNAHDPSILSGTKAFCDKDKKGRLRFHSLPLMFFRA